MTGFKKITSKFASSCRECGTDLAAGSTVEWKKGAGVRCYGGGCDSTEDASERRYFAAIDDHYYGDRYEAAEYARGYYETREIQAISKAGSAFREQLYMEAELAAYNRGE